MLAHALTALLPSAVSTGRLRQRASTAVQELAAGLTGSVGPSGHDAPLGRAGERNDD
jgi:hypothetical protein